MATAYTAFLPEVAPHCEGAPEIQVVNAIRNSVIEFCELSWVYISTLTAIDLVADQQDYTLTAPANTAIAKILYGYYDELPVDPITRDTVNAEFPTWRTQTGTKPSRFLSIDANASVSLIPIPSAAQSASETGIEFTVALKPTRASTDVATWLYEKYLEDIAKGALFRMYSMPKKFWTNANLAAVNKTLFMDAISKARADASKSFTRAPNRNRNTGVARW